MKKLKAIDARHKAACRMKIEGKSNADIVAALSIQKRTLVLWFSDDLVVEYMQTLAENVEEEFAVQLASAGMKSLSTLTGILEKSDTDDSASDHLKLEVAREIMDRLPGTTRVRERKLETPDVPPGGQNSLTQIFTGMSNNELAGFLNGGWKELNDQAQGEAGPAGQAVLPASNSG